MITETVKAEKKRGPFEMSSDTRILFNIMEKVLVTEKKEFIGYQELSESIARDVQKEARGLLVTARRHIQNQYKILIECISNEGLKKTEDYEGAIDRAKEHIRRTVRRRTRDVGQAINGKEINSSLAAKLSIMGAIELFTRHKIPQKLIERIEQKKLKELSTAETLKLFEP